MTRPSGLILLLTLALGLPSVTSAQTQPHDSFPSLMRTLKRGQTVVVVDVDGRKVKGEVAGLTESTLALDVSERLSPTGRVEFAERPRV